MSSTLFFFAYYRVYIRPHPSQLQQSSFAQFSVTGANLLRVTVRFSRPLVEWLNSFISYSFNVIQEIVCLLDAYIYIYFYLFRIFISLCWNLELAAVVWREILRLVNSSGAPRMFNRTKPQEMNGLGALSAANYKQGWFAFWKLRKIFVSRQMSDRALCVCVCVVELRWTIRCAPHCYADDLMSSGLVLIPISLVL